MPKKTSLITIIIHTKNEASQIKECIKSAKLLSPEIIVADMNSQDETVKITRQEGVQILPFSDKGYAGPARQISMKKAKTPWVLMLDADERLTKTSAKALQKVVDQDEADAVWIPYKNIVCGSWLSHGQRWPDYKMYFFKKDLTKYPPGPHDQPITDGRIIYLEPTEANAIVHYNYTSIAQLMEKTDRYTSYEDFWDSQKKITPEMMRDRVLHEFYWRFFEGEGYKDGMAGLVMAKFMEFYRFLEFAKYWERQGYPEMFSKKQLYEVWNREAYVKHLETELTILRSSKVFKLWQFLKRVKHKLLPTKVT